MYPILSPTTFKYKTLLYVLEHHAEFTIEYTVVFYLKNCFHMPFCKKKYNRKHFPGNRQHLNMNKTKSKTAPVTCWRQPLT